MENETVKNEILDELIITHTTTAARILATKNGANAFTLYNFYCYMASKQRTQQVWANREYCMKGLGWGHERLDQAFETLERLKVVERVVTRNADGTMGKPYVKIHYLQFKASEREVNHYARHRKVVQPQGGFQPANALDKKEVLKIKKNNHNLANEFAGQSVNELIPLFQEVNPTWERLFSNRSERAALERLLKQYGEKLPKMISALAGIVSRPYAPRVTKPTQLESKMGELKIFTEQSRGGASGKGGLRVVRTS